MAECVPLTWHSRRNVATLRAHTASDLLTSCESEINVFTGQVESRI